MSRRISFARWIEDLEYEVIQREFGYEDGEFTVYPDHWRAQWKRGDTPLQAFQSALDAYAEARREKEAERAANWKRIKASDASLPPTPPAGDGWLLEREGKSGPEWLIAYGDVSAPIFSKDANDALRWPTDADAADFAKQWRVTNVVPTEHMWPPPVSKGEKL